ncbi:MAG: hypothetical protein EOM06_09660 [Sphingobacteriia bacterium]|nr:hypothetical protein [Sphingobacteriia bacterium]
MESTLLIYDNILFLELRPYRHRERRQDFFKKLLSALESTRYQYQPFREVNFLPPYSPKLSYYHRLISNEAAAFFNHLNRLMQQTIDEEEKIYHVYTALNKVVGEKLKQTASEINRLKYNLDDIIPGSDCRLKNPVHAEESYIFQLMKLHLIVLYLNIQDTFGDFLQQEKYDEKNLYFIFFAEKMPEPSFIQKAETIITPILSTSKKKQKQFDPVRDDLPSRMKSKMDYSFVRNPERFAEIESRLYEYEIIDLDYHFIRNKKQRNHTLLAAIYRELIDKNYFRRNIIKSKAKIKDHDIRQYLDTRYATDTSQQFRKLTERQRNFAQLKLPWMEKILRIP